MRTSTSNQLVLHLTFNLLTLVSHCYGTSTHHTQPSVSNSKRPTTATSLYTENSDITSSYQKRSSSWNSKWLTTATSSDITEQTDEIKFTEDKGTTSDSVNNHDRQHKVNDVGTILSYGNETASSTNNEQEMTQSYFSTGMKNKGIYKRSTENQTISSFFPDSTSKNDTDKLFEMDTCALYSTCEHVSNLPFEFCRCDELCSTYKDCCINYQNISTNGMDSIEHVECTPYSNDNRRDGILAITRCPDDEDETGNISIKCQSTDVLTVGPMVVDDAGFVYRNKFCAECHNKTHLRPFSLEFSNVPSTFLDRFTDMNATSFIILQELLWFSWISSLQQVPPDGQNVRRCIQYTPGSKDCPEIYTSPVITIEGLYRNKFCIPSKLDQLHCFGNDSLPLLSDLDRNFQYYELSVMLSFGNTDTDCINQASGLCFDQQMYRGYKFVTEYVLVSNVELSELQQLQFLLLFQWILPSDVRMDVFETSPPYNLQSSMNVDVSIGLVILREMEGTQMLAYKSLLRNLQCQIVIQQSAAEPIRINIMKTIINYDETKTMMGSFNYRFVSNNEMELANISISAKKKDTACIQNFIEGELVGNTSLVIQQVECTGKMLNRSRTAKTSTKKDKMKIILTCTGLGISMLALIGSIIIHRYLRMHESIPGSNVENVSVSLLLSTVLYLFGIGANDYPNVCYIVGVSLHYLWLAVFSFMSISMINMFHNLRKMSVKNTVIQKSKIKTRLTIVGLLLPSLFVAPGVILGHVGTTGLDSQYDGTICFPTGYPAAVICVLCPIGLSILVNLTCFIGIDIVLTKNQNASENIRKSSSYQYLYIYTRISVVTGLFWIAGLLVIVTPTYTVEYVFIMCCSLQGFVVAVCNLTTKHVIQQGKEHTPDHDKATPK